MTFEWTNLITPAAITACFGGIAKLLHQLLNHKATENAQMIANTVSERLDKSISTQTVALTQAFDKGNQEVVQALKEKNERRKGHGQGTR
jgi:hypothetical protein